MDLLRIVERLVPDVEWVGNVVDASSKASLQETFYSPSGQPFPTNAEGLAAWAEIQAEDAAEAEAAAELADLDKANTWLTSQITPMSSISAADRTRLRDILFRIYKNYKYGK